VALVDLNKDGAPEIVTSTKRGTFLFWNQWKRGPTAERQGKKPAATSSASANR
jgi:hypothetical protein